MLMLSNFSLNKHITSSAKYKRKVNGETNWNQTVFQQEEFLSSWSPVQCPVQGEEDITTHQNDKYLASWHLSINLLFFWNEMIVKWTSSSVTFDKDSVPADIRIWYLTPEKFRKVIVVSAGWCWYAVNLQPNSARDWALLRALSSFALP